MQFLKTTIVGGVVFLVPVVIFAYVIGKALAITQKMTAPFTEMLRFSPAVDALVVNLLGLTLIVIVCFLGGLVAKSEAVSKLVESVENSFLSKIPIYALIKSTVSGTLQGNEEEGMKSVLVRLDDCWQIGFEMERLSGGKVTVFLPGSPDPWSGSICFVSEDRITKLDAKFLPVTKVLKGFGKGSSSVLPVS